MCFCSVIRVEENKLPISERRLILFSVVLSFFVISQLTGGFPTSGCVVVEVQPRWVVRAPPTVQEA